MTTIGPLGTPSGMNPASVFSGDLATHPFPLVAQLRAAGAVVAVPFPWGARDQGMWMVTRWEEAVHVLKNARITVDPTTVVRDEGQPVLARGRSSIFGESMIAVDEPAHRRWRSRVSQAVSPQYRVTRSAT